LTHKYIHENTKTRSIKKNDEVCISTEYQPIKNIVSGEVIGYEALARFSVNERRLDTEEYLKEHSLLQDSLYHLEILVKEHQVKHRPEGKTLFLNLSAHSCQTSKSLDFWQTVMKNNKDIVFELIEKTDHTETDFPVELFEIAEDTGTRFALDDFLCTDYIFIPSLFLKSSTIKLDKTLLRRAKEDKEYRETLKGIVKLCNNSGKKVIAEGIETKKDMEIVKEYGILYGQGYHFRNEFIVAE